MKVRRITQTLAAAGLAAVAVSATATDAHAVASIVNTAGTVALGINDAGHLNIPDSLGLNPRGGSLGLSFVPLGDATSPGCACEGWGVSATTGGGPVSGYANVSIDGVVNLVVDTFVSAVSSATSSVHLTSTPGLKVIQAYSEADVRPAVFFKNEVSILNDTGGMLDDVRYVRVMDWDIPPTEYSEFVTIRGTATTTLLERSHDNGFSTANPLVSVSPIFAATLNVDFTDSGPSDHGAYFRFNFGELADGESHDFTIFYGAARNETLALEAISAEGIELFSLGQSNSGGSAANDGVTFIFGFKGVGGTPVIPSDPAVPAVPEPITATLGGLGLAALASATRRRRA